MTTPTARLSQPVTAASRLLAKLDRQGLRDLVDDQTAMDIEVAARFTIQQHLCVCDLDEKSHIVGDGCPTHHLHPSN